MEYIYFKDWIGIYPLDKVRFLGSSGNWSQMNYLSKLHFKMVIPADVARFVRVTSDSRGVLLLFSGTIFSDRENVISQ